MGFMERAKLLQRRNGSNSGAKGNSTLAQRYLAAIEGDAVELLLPQSPAASSYATKQTAKTVEESSGSWHAHSQNNGTSGSATGHSPSFLRRKRPLPQRNQALDQQPPPQQQQLQQQQLNSSDDVSTPTSSRRREPNRPTSDNHDTTTRRGFFPRTQVRAKNRTDGRGISSDDVVPSSPAVPLGATRSRLPMLRSPSRRAHHQHQHHPLYQSDEASSLSSRRTSESAWSPHVQDWKLMQSQPDQDWRNQHAAPPLHKENVHEPSQRRSHDRRSLNQSIPPVTIVPKVHRDRQSYPANHPLLDHMDSLSMESSYTGTTSQDFTSLPSQQRDLPHAPPRGTTLSPMRPFSMEKTFGTAVDMIINTNAWACSSGNNTSQPRAPHSVPHRARVASRKSPVTEMKYAPQRHEHASTEQTLQPSLSIETPRSDYTGASTEIATNRAVDLAMKRIRAIESGAHADTTLPRMRHSSRDEDLRLAAKSILSLSSTESSAGEPTATQSDLAHPTGKLGLHMGQDRRRDVQDDASRSISSSGADVVEGNVYQMAKSSLRSVTGTSRNVSAPRQSFHPDEDDDSSRSDAARLSHALPPASHTANTPPDARRSETRTYHVSAPVTPYSIQRPTSDSLFDGIDACVSPPHIVRKMHSYDDASPDPVFCSKSMSMSVQSSQILSHPRAVSPFSSADDSFQSDNAMFMEKAEESCSSAMSNSVPEVEQQIVGDGLSYDSLKLRYENGTGARAGKQNQSFDSQRLSTHISGRNHTNRVAPSAIESMDHTSLGESSVSIGQGTGNGSRDTLNQDVLGIQGAFPQGSNFEDYPYPREKTVYSESLSAIQSKSFDDSVGNISSQRLVPLVPLTLPAPRTSGLHGTTIYERDELASDDNFKAAGRPNHNKGVANAFLTAIASKPTMREAADNEQPNTQGGLNEKISCSKKATRYLDIDVDVKSLRSTFESIASPDLNDGDDDDTASVKSLRDIFEPPPPPPLQTENAITKTRAMFEAKKPVVVKPPFEAGNNNLKETFSKFEARASVRLHGMRQTSNTTGYIHQKSFVFDLDKGDGVDGAVHETPFSVADRVRAFAGENEAKQSHYSAPDKPNGSSLESSQPVRTTRISVVLAHRSARQKMLTWRALRRKTSKFDQGNEFPAQSLKLVENDVADTEKTSESVGNRNPTTLMDSGSLNQTTGREEAPTTSVAVPEPEDNRKRSLKPTWLAQREKILSRARTPDRTPALAVQPSKDGVTGGVADTLLATVNAPERLNSPFDHPGTVEKTSGVAIATATTELPPSHTGATQLKSETDFLELQSICDLKQQSDQGMNDHMGKAEESEFALLGPTPQQSTTPNGADMLPAIVQQNDDNVSEYVSSRQLQDEGSVASATEMVPHTNERLPVDVDKDAATHSTRAAASISRADSLDRSQEEEKKESTPDDFDEVLDQRLGFALEPSQRDLTIPSFRDSSNFVAEPITTASKERPVVIKPVARKPYIRPVAFKPVVKPVPIMPFARSTNAMNRAPSTKNKSREFDVGTQRFVPSDPNDDPLALPTLVADNIQPFSSENIIDTPSDDSEFSDGVTLDLSIAEVSNLTNPTALVSRGEGLSLDWDQSRSVISEDGKHTSDDRSKADEAKRSEASSSQTSEAAAPLLAQTLRAFPLSDEFSADSFFRNRVALAKQLWNDKAGASQVHTFTTPDGMSEEKSSDFFAEDSHSWDVWHVESLFPVSSMKPAEKGFGDWNPFPSDRVGSPVETGEPVNERPVTVTPSRLKTPTRGNVSKTTSTSSIALPALDNAIPLETTSPETRRPEPDRTDSGTHPVQSLLPVSSGYPSLKGTPALSSASSEYASSFSAGSQTYGAKHVALLARIHALKEARLRRAAAIYNSTSFPTSVGGGLFISGLEVD